MSGFRLVFWLMLLAANSFAAGAQIRLQEWVLMALSVSSTVVFVYIIATGVEERR